MNHLKVYLKYVNMSINRNSDIPINSNKKKNSSTLKFDGDCHLRIDGWSQKLNSATMNTK